MKRFPLLRAPVHAPLKICHDLFKLFLRQLVLPVTHLISVDIAHQFIIGRIRRGIQFAAHFQIIQYF